MVRRDSTRNLLNGRVDALVANLESYLAAYTPQILFPSASEEFHRLTIAQLRGYPTPAAALQDEHFCERLWMTTQLWVMRKRGEDLQGRPLAPPASLIAGLRQNAQELERLGTMRIDEVRSPEEMAGRLWRLIGNLEISATKSKVVQGAKLLHHLLPELMPPIDRRYTGTFFAYHPTRFQEGEPVFTGIYSEFCKIARRLPLDQHVAWPLHTSITKVMDNAIIGYCLSHDLLATRGEPA